MTDIITFARVDIQGEIANRRDLEPTSGGLLSLNILVYGEGRDGKKVPNYIEVKFFRPQSDEIARTYKVGDVVRVAANIRMEKGPRDQYYQQKCYGTTIAAPGDAVDALAAAFDAVDLPLPGDDLPF